MGMEGIVSFGNKRNYDDFKKQIPADVLPLFDSIREFCFKLGENVVEDYFSLKLSLRIHPVALLRHKLTPGYPAIKGAPI